MGEFDGVGAVSAWTIQRVLDATGGRWRRTPSDEGLRRSVLGFSTDSRTIQPGQVFVALRGERFDGAKFVGDALRAGASLAIVERASEPRFEREASAPIAVVDDTVEALFRLAQEHRRTLSKATVIGVTGSNGKTTTTRMLEAILSRGVGLNVCASPGSFNNRVGVPLTILQAETDCDALVCEIGANAPGEIADLASLVRPHIAIITLIGRAHAAGLGGPAGIAREKASLARFLEPGGSAIVPANCPQLHDALPRDVHNVTFGAEPSADCRVCTIEHIETAGGEVELRFEIDGLGRFSAPLLGGHNARNAAAAIATARRIGLDAERIALGLRAVQPPPMRLSLQRRGGIDLFNDAYNASPESTASAIRSFFALTAPTRRRVIVLGDMLELGAIGPAAHREAGELIGSLGGVDVFAAVGPLARFAADRLEEISAAKRVMRIESLDDSAARRIGSCVEPGDAVLLKGSRRVGLERLAEALSRRRPEAVGVGGGP